MTNNTQFKTLVNTWLNQKKPMITPSTHASFTLITENHLIPYFGKRKIGSTTSFKKTLIAPTISSFCRKCAAAPSGLLDYCESPLFSVKKRRD